MINVTQLADGGSIAQNTGKAHLVDVTQKINSSLTVTVVCMHTGGTISITLKWSPDGKNFITQAAATTGDVANITTGNIAWDNFVLPGIPQILEITVTEENAAACTDYDLALLCY